MNPIFLATTILLLALLPACQDSAFLSEQNQFSTTSDTLIVQLKKVKGAGLFSLAAGILSFKDTSKVFSYPVLLPESLQEVKGARMSTDFSPNETHAIDIIRALREEEEIFIVDQNDNQDFTDDTVRTFQEMQWYSSEQSIHCSYLMFKEDQSVRDSSWVKIGMAHGNAWYGRDEHLLADVWIDEQSYTLGVVDERMAMTFLYGDYPEIAFFATPSGGKDTLLLRDRIARGEFLLFNDTYYRFDSITPTGDEIVLVKEVDVEQQVGTQIGMIAPDFQAVSMDGDTMSLSQLMDKPIVIANSCGCGGDTASTAAFFEIRHAFGERLHTLRLDSQIKEGQEGIHIDVADAYNSDVYQQYRKAYCSRVSYVIGTNGRIVDKFMITSWESFLASHVQD